MRCPSFCDILLGVIWSHTREDIVPTMQKCKAFEQFCTSVYIGILYHVYNPRIDLVYYQLFYFPYLLSCNPLSVVDTADKLLAVANRLLVMDGLKALSENMLSHTYCSNNYLCLTLNILHATLDMYMTVLIIQTTHTNVHSLLSCCPIIFQNYLFKKN